MRDRTVDKWIDFIVLKNIDPVVKSRFARSIHYLMDELKKIETRLNDIKDGMITQKIEEYVFYCDLK